VNVVIVAVGRVRGPLEPAVAEYEGRAGRYWKLEVTEVGAGATGRDPSPERVKEAEGERILARIPQDAEVIALTRTGKGIGSAQLANTMEELAVRSFRHVVFVLGGAYGLHARVLDRADRRLSLSPMTLPHEMARLVLAEQLYRAGTIIRGEPYHKGA
jgi:23S rRNA (pseudouridine1915-N3)-methyltransferase